MYYLIYSLYALFATAVLSASFGVAVAISSFYLLFFASIIVCWKFRDRFYFLLHEKIALALVAWLVFAAMIRPNAFEGIEFVISEYRTLWMFPFIGFAISMVLRKKELLTPLIVGSTLNWLGSFLLGLKAFSFPFGKYIGLVGAPGSEASLGGKFVQSIILTFWSGIWFAFSILTSKRGRFFLVVTVLWMVAMYLGFALMDARSGLLASIIGMSAIGFAILSSKFNRYLAGIIVLLGLFFFAGILMTYGPKRIQLISAEATVFFKNGANTNSSVGMRLESLSSVSELKFEELVLGLGGGNWYSRMVKLQSEKKINMHYLKWRDFHSEAVWLTMLGGLVAVFFYLSVACIVIAQADQGLGRGDWFAGGLGIGIATLLLAFGLFNSIFTNVRESHLLGLALVVWSSWMRYTNVDTSRLRDKRVILIN